ncbi:hypothetical protein O181_090787 [Austropuccinia psidii MF-1]|uniref:Uncharacterized protein n=1 Tax=Austropuccinia psidii MF-1 TaxID=1389203 RepID=A0A9Q3IW82_9BASI|nr:hypothetical protein [Austropuccinia psidii MF-1]
MQNSQPFRPRYALKPIDSSHQPYVPHKMAPRKPLNCHYCLEEGNSTIRCNNLPEDLEKIIVSKFGGTYLFPNFERVPTEGPISAKELVKQFAKEQEELTKNMIEKSNQLPKQQKPIVIENPKDEKAATIAQIEEWGNWKPPQISPSNENLQINVRLRKRRQRAARQENPIQTQKEITMKDRNPSKRRYQVPSMRKMRQKRK